MGDILKKEARYREALDTYLEVCYLDLNGPNNCGTLDPSILKEFPPFDPKDESVAPVVVCYVVDILERQNMSKNDARTRFCEIAAKVQHTLNLPVAPDQA